MAFFEKKEDKEKRELMKKAEELLEQGNYDGASKIYISICSKDELKGIVEKKVRPLPKGDILQIGGYDRLAADNEFAISIYASIGEDRRVKEIKNNLYALGEKLESSGLFQDAALIYRSAGDKSKISTMADKRLQQGHYVDAGFIYALIGDINGIEAAAKKAKETNQIIVYNTLNDLIEKKKKTQKN